MTNAASNTVKDEWPTIYSGGFFTRLRRRLFGLNAAEMATRWRMVNEMQARIREDQEREDLEFDDWWEREGKWECWPWNVADTRHFCVTSACACEGPEVVFAALDANSTRAQ